MEPIDDPVSDDSRSARPRPATEAEYAVLATRLEDFIAGYLELGEKLGVDPEAEAVLAAVDHALAQAQGQTWQGEWPADVAERQFLIDLAEELGQEREGLYDHWFDARGGEHFSPIGDEEWLAVLRLLRQRVERLAGG